MATLDIYQGDSRTVMLTFVNDDGSYLNISGMTVYYVAAQSFSTESTPVIFKTITGHDVPQSGMTHMDLTTGDTNICPQIYIAEFRLYSPPSGLSTFGTDGLNIIPAIPLPSLS